VAVARKVKLATARWTFRTTVAVLRSWVRAWHRMKALDSCCRRVDRAAL